MSDGDNPFLLPPQDIDGGGVDAHTHHDKNVTTAEQPSVSPASGKDNNNNNVDDEAEATAMTRRDDVNDLIPLCVQHASGPRLSTAVYGYDIAQMQRRPWREPGAKITDYFNYGFNEASWRAYCALQKDGEASLLARAEEVLRKLQQAAGSSGGGVGQSRCMMGTAQSASRFGARNATTGAAPVGHTPSPLPQSSSSPLSSSVRAAHTHMPMTSGSDVYGQHMASAYKTRMCQHHLEGRCGRGAHCNYAHSITELRTLQPAATATVAVAAPSSSAMPLPPPPPVQPAAKHAYGGQTPMAAGASDNYYAHTLLPAPSTAAAMPPPPPHATRYPSPPYTQGNHVLPPPPHAAPADYYAAPPLPAHMPSGGDSGASMLPPPPSTHDLRSHDGSDGQASLYRAEAVSQSGYVPPHPHMRYDTSMPPPPAGRSYRGQPY